MKISNGMLGIKEMADLVGVSPNTLRNWLKWWESYPEGQKPEGIVFPSYVRVGKNQQRMFTLYDVSAFRIFKAQLHNAQVMKVGIMSDYNKGGQKHAKKD